MIKIGMIGAENSHAAAIAKLCNVEKRVDARVVAIWGEKPEFAEATAKAGEIPKIVDNWMQLLGQVDGVMICHRHAMHHAEPAKFFLGKGVPAFVDKPFTYRLRDAKALCKLAVRKKTPVTGYSILPISNCFQSFKERCSKMGTIVSYSSTGPSDLASQYGGIFFYAVHQVECAIELLGTDVERVQVTQQGKTAVATMAFTSGRIATLHLLNNGNGTFHFTAAGDKEVIAEPYKYDDAPYLGGLQTFLRMFETKQEPLSHARLLAPIAALEAMEKSVPTGKWVKVASIA